MFSLLCILPVLLNAANVFIWDYDPTDEFYCPDAGMTIDCKYWVQQTLTTLGHTFTTDTVLPLDVTSYDVVFALCGWYTC
jgi:hypothetical protein